MAINVMNMWAKTRALRPPSILTGVEAKKQIKERILDNRAIATNKTGFELGINNGMKMCKNSLSPQPKFVILMGSENLSKIRWNALKTWRIHNENKIYVTIVRLYCQMCDKIVFISNLLYNLYLII
jgi:hypothetical protein